LTNVINRSEDLFQQGPQQFFPGQTVAGFNPFQTQALQGAFDQSQQFAPLGQAGAQSIFGALNPFAGGNFGAQTLGQFARGDFQQNPFLANVFNQSIAPRIQENVNTPFLQGGRFGSAANTAALTRELGNTANDFFGQQFANEQRNRLGAAGQLGQFGLQGSQLIPGFQGGQIQNQGQLFGLGQQLQNQEQAQIQGDINRFNFNQQAPGNLLREQFGFLNPINIGQFARVNQPSTSGTEDFIRTGGGVIQTGANLLDLFGGVRAAFQ
jgi:hypothetical protein